MKTYIAVRFDGRKWHVQIIIPEDVGMWRGWFNNSKIADTAEYWRIYELGNEISVEDFQKL